MYDYINEPVTLQVLFSENKVRPTAMRWSGRDYSISSVDAIHISKEGDRRIYHFSVSDIANSFKLRFDTESLQWRLIEIYHDG